MIKIAFYWHQHQPYYKDNLTDEYSMPWVRLHGIKDYIGMALLLENFPKIHQTFNFVPCLLDQLKDYEDNRARDRFWRLTEISAVDLTEADKWYLLDNFFSANHQTMIDIYPRYKELLKKRSFRKKKAREVLGNFSHEDVQDLQVWANLAWYHPFIIQRDSILSELVKKGAGFTKEDKAIVLSKQIDVIRQIIPLHKRLQESKQIEITTSPYYHPILPLLCNQESAKVVLPKLSLPKRRLMAAEDAKKQVEKAAQAHKKYFGQDPCGMWPSEGAVSDDIIPILTQAGFRWLASDEEILASSLGHQIVRDQGGEALAPELLYRPYRIDIKGNTIHMVFRDHHLSDLIGFQYSKYHADAAVSDFLNRIHRLEKQDNHGKPFLVAIILDGENAWEYYPKSGVDFLTKLYETISSDRKVECVRMCDYLKEYPPEQTIHHLVPGSWIEHNLATWIGHEEKNAAWDLIEDTRSFLFHQPQDTTLLSQSEIIHKAWEEIFIAEGSDWFWWFGDDHVTQYKDEFDRLFRLHLQNVYKLLNSNIPRRLDIPIARTDVAKPYTYPRRFLRVKLDGVVSNYFEWLDAGRYNAIKDMDTMHRASEQPICNVFFGFDIDNLFVRVDFKKDLFLSCREKGILLITFVEPEEWQVSTSLLMDKPISFKVTTKSGHHEMKDYFCASFDTIVELSFPFASMGLLPGIDVVFFIELVLENEVVQRIPRKTVFSFSVPSTDFEKMMWQV
ncbi:MAG: alpha-amylase/alpha-mannosidase [Candidatus Brocadia sp. WS118]|nr:MAG: alpha-amylase/alpha-mannosidase [Candidatus Brocadia sp. WS118]